MTRCITTFGASFSVRRDRKDWRVMITNARRGFLAAAVLMLAAAGAAPGRMSAHGSDGRIRMRTLRPGDILYVLLGGGGNSLALMRAEGVVLIDTKLASGGRQILETIQAVSERPVSTIINTHAHLDHAGGNVAFAGVTEIVAHEHARA